MGVIAEQFRLQLDEMRARHAETDRRVETSLKRLQESIKELNRLNEEIDLLID